ncbi:hypothetical protein AS594_34040 [Streptomyces agglomeratus]|uniref:Uncharacterized protein n=1 Tax=Streptomyces agglomeratus TaxID=285458 RepID=A0A1E5PGS4_9ACTN|nr:hypothetical protein [Streptomyces agglomeratus]OEJ28731.1 hypothetical protein AS594_34040 [Streptomyces agglomeratus]OEJ49753.1 hypothetical protein BGK72_02040 [Streptomyces agglomeratus]
MSTSEEHPSPDEALARARAAAKKMDAALDEDHEPEPDEPLGCQPVWKRPRKPKSKAKKKEELHKQRWRLQDAGRRRLAAGQSRRPRSRQNRIGNAAARRDARALSRVRHSNAWLW